MKKNVIVGQSGGPTAVINASLYGVVYEALMQKEQIGTYPAIAPYTTVVIGTIRHI